MGRLSFWTKYQLNLSAKKKFDLLKIGLKQSGLSFRVVVRWDSTVSAFS